MGLSGAAQCITDPTDRGCMSDPDRAVWRQRAMHRSVMHVRLPIDLLGQHASPIDGPRLRPARHLAQSRRHPLTI